MRERNRVQRRRNIRLIPPEYHLTIITSSSIVRHEGPLGERRVLLTDEQTHITYTRMCEISSQHKLNEHLHIQIHTRKGYKEREKSLGRI